MHLFVLGVCCLMMLLNGDQDETAFMSLYHCSDGVYQCICHSLNCLYSELGLESYGQQMPYKPTLIC